ncbi:hypothetical protein Ancab_018375 [Ancistrocladus abbreviatus]
MSSIATNFTSCKSSMVLSDQFPAGLRVLVVDDDTTCLKILEQMLRRCLYAVTLCSQATVALDMLRERKGYFDVVLSDVHMPDMDGYKLLEHVGQEMDLPVIMMSGDGRTSAVMRGIRHGACDYLIKPIREEELKNIWQHVVRKRWNENKELEHSGSLENTDPPRRGNDDSEYASSVNEVTEVTIKAEKKRRDSNDDDDVELENDDTSTSKRPRVVWSVELHQQFVSAVNQLGLDKAVPKRILELMNVPGLTRENVASHLQKFRLYLKRLSSVAQQQGGIQHSFCSPMETNIKFGSLGRFDIQALATSGQVPSQTLASLHAELLGELAGDLSLIPMDQPTLLQGSLLASKCVPIEQGASFPLPLVKCQSNTSKPLSQSTMYSRAAPSSGTWPSGNLGTVIPNGNIEGLNSQNINLFSDILCESQQQLEQQPLLPEISESIIVQPSCLVVPSQQSTNFQEGNRLGYLNHSCSINRVSVIDSIPSQSNSSPMNVSQISHGDPKTNSALGGCSATRSPSLSSCSVNIDIGNGQWLQSTMMASATTRQLPGPVPSACNLLASYATKSAHLLDQGSCGNIGAISRVPRFPSRFAVEPELIAGSLDQSITELNHGSRVKQEPDLESVQGSKMGFPVSQQYPPNDLMHLP